MDSAHSLLLFKPDPLLVLQQERMPGLFHVQVAATHLGLLSMDERCKECREGDWVG
jgi:hypothetical protein